MDPALVSIILPARNEATSLAKLLPLIATLKAAAEIIIVNDGSTDLTAEIAHNAGARVIEHPYSLGNGAAVKAGTRAATGEILVFMDADGQHDPADIPRLLAKLDEGFDMVVGARSPGSQASLARRMANGFYNWLASAMTGHEILDLTSGFRVVRADRFRKFLYLLPNGFSYPTTSTMAFFRSGFPVAYVPIHAGERQGKSKIRLLHDGARFFVIILRIGALFSPMRFFLPISGFLFFSGLGLYAYNYMTQGRFTNMSLLLFMSALFTFLMGILSEQVSSLHYRGIESGGSGSGPHEPKNSK
jgi:glycosyltransferase involved in cell wall biosynthesis